MAMETQKDDVPYQDTTADETRQPLAIGELITAQPEGLQSSSTYPRETRKTQTPKRDKLPSTAGVKKTLPYRTLRSRFRQWEPKLSATAKELADSHNSNDQESPTPEPDRFTFSPSSSSSEDHFDDDTIAGTLSNSEHIQMAPKEIGIGSRVVQNEGSGLHTKDELRHPALHTTELHTTSIALGAEGTNNAASIYVPAPVNDTIKMDRYDNIAAVYFPDHYINPDKANDDVVNEYLYRVNSEWVDASPSTKREFLMRIHFIDKLENFRKLASSQIIRGGEK